MDLRYFFVHNGKTVEVDAKNFKEAKDKLGLPGAVLQGWMRNTPVETEHQPELST